VLAYGVNLAVLPKTLKKVRLNKTISDFAGEENILSAEFACSVDDDSRCNRNYQPETEIPRIAFNQVRVTIIRILKMIANTFRGNKYDRDILSKDPQNLDP
jgi:hypothetical protein